MLELATFRLVDGADRDAFVAADARYQTGVAYQHAGLVRRTLAERDGGWLVVTHWSDDAAADACPPFEHAAVDRASLRVERYDELPG